ncbi:hypothetical protein TrVE_jg9341 [Triparma verrucosa]|uniref:Uncharacterized protein n=1 Tax=Triparma verrucosa TaxID=1606542 RepID=A0A9W6ZAE1_9STRA|nr:hypothetical protein TrVE_jg9341 [Triparma verrucosa]
MPSAHGYDSISDDEGDPMIPSVRRLSNNRSKRKKLWITFGLVLMAFCGLSVGIYEVTVRRKVMLDSDAYSPSILSSKGMKHLKKGPVSAPLGCTVDVMIIRHCERGNLRRDCTDYGQERNEFISTLFGGGEDARYPTPSLLYARAEEGKKLVRRSKETITPLSEKAHIPINNEYGVATKKHMVEGLFSKFRDGELCGAGPVVISWKHENIPKLAAWLGCTSVLGCPEDYGVGYDNIWSIRYRYDQPEYSSKKSGSIGGPAWDIQGAVLHEGFDIVAWEKQKKLEAKGAGAL